MLGFTAFSEAPISQATTSALALAYLSSVGSILYAEDVLYNAVAYVNSPSATASFTANPLLFDARALLSISGVTSATAINNVAYDAKANITTNAATSTLDVGTLDFNALAYITITSAIADILNGGIEFDAKANTSVSNVAATITAYDFQDVYGEAKSYITTLLATFYQSLDDPISVTFDYQQYADSYERNRTLYIVSDVKGHTVHIPERESTTIYLGAQDTNRTVKIAA
tara:strand:- start:531 stop:1217 length:687 start_codon:yes stop_codon:yes gene_type:complete